MQDEEKNKDKNEVEDEKNSNGNSDNSDELESEETEKELPNEEEVELSIKMEDESLKLLNEIATLKGENSDLKDQLLRVKAEGENFKKRILREQERAVSYANEKIILDLLPIIDNFNRAIDSGKNSENFENFYEGIVMIEKDFISKLENNWELKRFSAIGEDFDPLRHEAFAMEEKEGIDKEVIVEEFQHGYTLNGKIIRTAKVKVAKPL